MTDTPPKPRTARLAAQKAEREARLAAALRDNLRRRKAQASARDQDTPPRPIKNKNPA